MPHIWTSLPHLKGIIYLINKKEDLNSLCPINNNTLKNIITISTNYSMATTFSSIFSIQLPNISWNKGTKRVPPKRFCISAQVQETEQVQTENEAEEPEKMKQEDLKMPKPIEPQVNVKSRNLAREYGGQWLSSVTRHVRIYAAYIDPETCAMDQSQMDKLTLILDPTEEFLWTEETCNKVYVYFQELVDNYEGAPLTEYTLRLIGSDIEHYIRKMLYDGEIKYNMNSRVLNFSMGKPRMKFNGNELPDVQ